MGKFHWNGVRRKKISGYSGDGDNLFYCVTLYSFQRMNSNLQQNINFMCRCITKLA